MFRELVHFVRSAPSAARQRNSMSPAALLDLVESRLDRAGKARWRTALVAGLTGEILEIGAGSGAMFSHYPQGVRVTAIEPDEALRALAVRRAGEAPVPVDVRVGFGEDLLFPDASFDGVVCSSVLCCVRSVEETLGEIARVLKPRGSLRLLEHVKSDRLVAGALQEVFNPIWRAVNRQGCNMNRDPRAALRALGFTIEVVGSFQVFTPEMPAAFENLVMRAVRASPLVPDLTGVR